MAPAQLSAPVQRNAWLKVSGRLERDQQGEFRVRADSVEAIDEPTDPYL